jgi:hypothetical protein
MTLSLRSLLSGLIDYAGLFPPAGLDMPSTVANFARYRRSESSWMLARFILPASRLPEFEEASAKLFSGRGESGWRLSVLGGPDVAADLARVDRFNRLFAPAAKVDTLEVKAEEARQIHLVMTLLPAGITAFFEIPAVPAGAGVLPALATLGARAKVRTGALTPQGIPPADVLARFIRECADTGVPFKATAGLHHPLRSVRRLTYEQDSPSAVMHGFLNVFLAAAFAFWKMDVDQLTALLEDQAPASFVFDEQGAAWCGIRISSAEIVAARASFAVSFGSCSFEEPVEELRELGIMTGA